MTTTQTDPDSEGDVASRIREARKGAGLTQRELAALVGVTRHTVGSWEAGRTKPSREHLAAIAPHCETGVRELEGPEARGRAPLTREERMRVLVEAIAGYAAMLGYPPSMEELMEETGFSSKSVVKYWLDECEEAGLVVRARERARAVTLTEAGRAFAEGGGGQPVAEGGGGQPVVRRKSTAPSETGTAAAPDVATDARRPPRRSDRRTPARRGAYAIEAGPASGIAARIREARRSVSLTQRELAALVGVSSQTVWSWEAGRMRPTYEHRLAIASHCDLHVDELQGRTGPGRDRVHEAVVAFRGAVANLPDKDIESIWLFIGFVRWRRRRGKRAA